MAESPRINIRLNETEMALFKNIQGATDAERFRFLLTCLNMIQKSSPETLRGLLLDDIKSSRRMGRKPTVTRIAATL